MRILIATAGSRGDVEPFANLARRAIAEGHDVLLVVPDRSGVDLDGLDVASLGVDFNRMITDQGVSALGAMRSFRSVVRPLMRAVIVETAKVALDYRPDVVAAHPKILSAPLIAEALNIPHVLVETVPAMTPTSAFPAAGTVTRNLGRANRLTYRAAGMAAAMFRSEIDEAARLVAVSRRTVASPVATLMPISPAILARPGDWPDTVHLTGPWLDDRAPGVVDPVVAEFLEGGPYVYAGFGSMAAGDPLERARSVVRAVRDHGTRAILATGLGGLDVPRDLLGPDLLVVRSTDHGRVLPRAVAAVHHGGIGTIQAATRAGTVSVLVPFIADQPFWGARLHAQRLAPAPIPRRALTSKRLTAALADAASHQGGVDSAARTMNQEQGTREALSVIVSLV
jgi:sterol 3beta-glucosyltransferase